MDTLGKTIAKYRKERKMSQPDLAAELTNHGFPIKVSAISSWETGTTQPTAGMFLEVCKILDITDIYEDFIGENPKNLFSQLNEKGVEKVLDYIRLLILSDEYKKPEPVIIPFRLRSIPLFDLPASAGTGHFLDGENYEMIEVGNDVPENADFGIRVSGDSMTPRFQDKQIVWVQKTSQLYEGEIGIFYLDGNSYIKKLQSNTDGTFLVSLNPTYAPLKVTEDSSFTTFGRVIG